MHVSDVGLTCIVKMSMVTAVGGHVWLVYTDDEVRAVSWEVTAVGGHVWFVYTTDDVRAVSWENAYRCASGYRLCIRESAGEVEKRRLTTITGMCDQNGTNAT